MVSLYCMDFKHMAITFHIYFLFVCLFVSYRESYCYVISILWEAQDVSKSNFCEFVNVTYLKALEKGSMS